MAALLLARPTHAYPFSPGTDFETQILVKPNAAELLAKELATPGYGAQTIAMGTNTDPQQPYEKEAAHHAFYPESATRLQLSRRHRHEICAFILRDIDILCADGRTGFGKSCPFPSPRWIVSWRAQWNPAPARHRAGIKTRALRDAGVPTGVMFAPVIPALNDDELETVLEAARDMGAQSAGYVLLRLPLEIKDLFREWLEAQVPGRAKHVMSLIRQMRGGKDYDSDWYKRMTGAGPYAELIARRFHLAVKRLA